MSAAAPIRRPRALRVGVALAATAAALAATGCGSGSGALKGGDPATVTPASAAVYVGAVVRPEGSLKDNTVAVARKLTHMSDPFGALISTLEQAGGRRVDFNHDIKPWLGSRVGLFFTSLAGSSSGSSATGIVKQGLAAGLGSFAPGTQGAIVASTTDAAAARSFLQKDAALKGAHSATYKGVSYQVASDGTAEGLVGSFAVVGTESGLKAAVDTQQGGPGILHDTTYAQVAGRAAGALAHAYLNVPTLLASSASGSGSGASSSSTAAGLRLLEGLFAGIQGADLALTPGSGSAALDITTANRSAPQPHPTGAQALATLPSDSWLAVGIGDLGGTLGRFVTALQNAGPTGAGVASSLATLKNKVGIDLQHDIIGWMGQAGLFVAGTGLLDLTAALVVQSKDPTLSHAAIPKIGLLLTALGLRVTGLSLAGTDAGIAVHPKSLPVTIDVVSAQGKLVIGLGDASVTKALSGGPTLSTSASYTAAQSALGEGLKPSVIVDVPTLLSLLDGLGLSKGKTIAAIRPYLTAITTLVAGGQRQNTIGHSRVVIGVH